MANSVLRGACLREADMSRAQLDAAISGPISARRTLRGAGFRGALRGGSRLSTALFATS
jgi:uncharacterized protein YjbI with pentapeptide repeats